MLRSLYRWMRVIGTLGLVAVCCVALWRQSRGNIAAAIYRQRLEELSGRYSQLADLYNQAVDKTAVTELVVKDGTLSVVIRTAAGVVETIPTELDPAQEVHAEYLVQDGRLWIRRIYTLSDPDPAGKARATVVIIDPRLASPAWDSDPTLQGLSVFRKQLSEGRWIVTATGNAALALKKLPPGQQCDLASPPPVRDFATVRKEVDHELARLGLLDIAENIFNEP